ncbi:MAG: hypothetical protein A2076_15005 [Geobacteraceae bacterium GWC2_53_11]|nr:MAG: hypothetical protein A2076_15005 [Geobacteraceae bacterium GWC2_53_11]
MPTPHETAPQYLETIPLIMHLRGLRKYAEHAMKELGTAQPSTMTAQKTFLLPLHTMLKPVLRQETLMVAAQMFHATEALLLQHGEARWLVAASPAILKARL